MRHAAPVEPAAPAPQCAACGELPPEPLEPYTAAGMPTWRCVYPSVCLKRAEARRIGMWAPPERSAA